MKTNRTNEELNQILKNTISQVRSLGLPVGNIKSGIKITRTTKEFGRCELEQNMFTICISKYYKDNDLAEVKEVIAHEVLHTVNGCFNHGVQWKAAAAMMNKAFGYNIQRTGKLVMANLTEEEEAKFYKYVIKCSECGNLTYRQRKSKLVTETHHYKCKCGGQLELQ